MTDTERKELLSKAKPILFNTEMVRAILDGRKTVTRRVLKPHNSAKAKRNGYCQGEGLWYDDEFDDWLLMSVDRYPTDDIVGVISLLYRTMIAAAELRERLKFYEKHMVVFTE